MANLISPFTILLCFLKSDQSFESFVLSSGYKKNLNPLVFVNENIFDMWLLKDEMAANESKLRWIADLGHKEDNRPVQIVEKGAVN